MVKEYGLRDHGTFNENYVQILDEADNFLIDGSGLDNRPRDMEIFGVTATPVREQSVLEKELLRKLNLLVCDSSIQPFDEIAETTP